MAISTLYSMLNVRVFHDLIKFFSRLFFHESFHNLIKFSWTQRKSLLLICKAYKKSPISALCILAESTPLYFKLEMESKQARILHVNIPEGDF